MSAYGVVLGDRVRRQHQDLDVPVEGVVIEIVRDGWLVDVGEDHPPVFCDYSQVERVDRPDEEIRVLLDDPARDPHIRLGCYVVRTRDIKWRKDHYHVARDGLSVQGYGYVAGLGTDSYAVIWHNQTQAEYMGLGEVCLIRQDEVPPDFNRWGSAPV